MSVQPDYSLIVATVGRTEELRRFLRALSGQTACTIELIVVDQNEDDRLTPILAEIRTPGSCIHLRSPRGLSRARNRGLVEASGTIVAFPDDDCWYPPQFLSALKERFDTHPTIDGWTGMTRDANGTPSASRWSTRRGRLTKYNLWTRAMSPAIFLRRTAVRTIGQFNESLGVGSGTEWGSGEETDYLIRGLEAGLRLEYDPSIAVFHPQIVTDHSAAAGTRASSYGMGFGWVLRAHRYPLPVVIYHWARSYAGVLRALVQGDVGKARFSWRVLRGRVRGYFKQPTI